MWEEARNGEGKFKGWFPWRKQRSSKEKHPEIGASSTIQTVNGFRVLSASALGFIIHLGAKQALMYVSHFCVKQKYTVS